MSAGDPFKQIDAEIAYHYGQIDQHRLEIVRLQDARDVLMVMANRTFDQTARGRRPAAIEERAGTASASPVRITVSRAEAEPAKANGDWRGRQGRKRGSMAEKVADWFSKHPAEGRTSGEFMEILGPTTKQERQQVYQALFGMKKAGKLRQSAEGVYRRV